MRAPLIAAAVALAALLPGFALSTANAAPPAAVVIQAHPTQFCCPEIGTWEASGAIDDSGTYERTFVQSAPPDRPFLTLGPVREQFVFSGANGTLTVRAEERLTADGVTGVWEIASGTGAYADASGHGTVAFSVLPGPFNFLLTLSGVASKAD